MISASTISNAGNASNYFISEAKNEQGIAQERSGTIGEYYLNEQAPSTWSGAGAAMQGIEGQGVTKENIEAMMNGQVKEIKDGQLVDKQLGRTVTDKETQEKITEHKAGWDFTFSAPKSVSIEAEVFGNADVKQAHEEAVQATMKWLEANGAGTRMGKNKEFQQTGNLTWASFSHSTTREKDPQTHTHCLIQNLTYDQDGKAYSLESKGIYQLRALADRIYKNEMASNLKNLGLNVEFDKKGNFEIQGYTQEQLNTFSKRTDQIDSYLEKQGINPEKASAEQRQIATLQTRPKKDFEESRQAHYQKWEKEAAEHGITPATRSAEPQTRQTRQSASEVLNNAISSLTERESAFTAKQLWTEITKMNEGQVSLSALQNTLKSAMENGDILQKKESSQSLRETN
jgi:conjugative relaxase domain, TrwC/TraI family